MTLEIANKVLSDPTNVYEMTGIEKFILILVRDLQSKIEELTKRLEAHEESSC